ncbi:MAG: mevalonate kinase [Candidatus Aenigmarchaeota archaeon]|nr:mevalonate kinase [Candidatus Aenigmarchaeota archaeon]
MVRVSAPGKVHLIGEHAVVYGEPAILAAVGRRTYVSIEKFKDITYVDLAWPDISHTWTVEKVFELTQQALDIWNTCNEEKNFSELFNFIKKNGYEGYRASILGIAMKRLGISDGFSIRIDSKLPACAGLGSSASRAVAITMSIAKFFNKKISLKEVNDIAYEQEKIIHGTPGGGDNSACCFGGLIWFKKAQPKNEIKSLRKVIPYKLPNFVLVYLGQLKKTTGELVQLVRDLNEDYRNERVKKIGKMTYEMLDALKKRNFKKVKEIINLTQKNLAELGVSTSEIDRIAEVVREIGGAAKLCGAGGGGTMLCYHKDTKRLLNLIKNLGYEPLKTELAVKGVRIE